MKTTIAKHKRKTGRAKTTEEQPNNVSEKKDSKKERMNDNKSKSEKRGKKSVSQAESLYEKGLATAPISDN